MKMSMTRDISTGDIFFRISNVAFEQISMDVYTAEMREEIKHFIATDPQCQMLINEMTKEAFKGIDLLAVISEAINEKVKKSLAEQE